MSQNISDTFTLQLQQMRADVLAQIRARRGGRRSRADAAADALADVGDDWAVADAERDLAIALEERESAELVAIDEALRRIADGHFGICRDCGTDIDTARLHARPTTLRCAACQGRFEQAHSGH